MKILLINNCHYRRGGADVVYLNTGELLQKHGYEVIYFSSLSENNVESKYSSYFVEYKNGLYASLSNKFKIAFSSLYSLESKHKLYKLILDTKPDIAHVHLYKGVLSASILSVLKKMDIPTVISLHDFSLLCPRNTYFDADGKICERCSESGTINCIIKKCNRKNFFYSTMNFLEYNFNDKLFDPEKYFNRIICISKFHYNKHLTVKPELKEKLVQLYNFTPFLEKNVPNKEKGNYFLYFGRLSKEKGIYKMIEAFNNLPIQLKIVGTGNLDLDITNNIELLGFKSGNELERVISNSSFVILPSELYENNPMTIIEAYSFGKPVIGSRIGGIPEIIIDGETGFLFEMGNVDELKKIIIKMSEIKKEEYEIMSVKSRKFAEDNFSEDSHYDKLIKIYNAAINE